MPRAVRIANAHGFWGDRLDAAAELLSLEPELDFLTLDFLAEVSMSILALQQRRDAEAGFARDFLEVVRSLIPYWQSGGRCRVITNAGGLNPVGCGRACQRVLESAGCPPRVVAVVSGDEVSDLLRTDAEWGAPDDLARNLDTGAPISSIYDRLVTANVYLGARPIVEALDRGAELVVTGRVADPSLTVAPCVHHFGWAWDDWNRLAGATVAGHLIECGTQVTGGISTDWLDIPDVERIGFPIAEVDESGRCVVTKPRGSGGCVTPSTVKEQLLYEIGDPERYLSPDVTVSFQSLQVTQQSSDRTQVQGAIGGPPPETLKVSAVWQNGYRASGQLTIVGIDSVAKARRAAEMVMHQLRQAGISFQDNLVELVGGACDPRERDEIPVAARFGQTVLRISVADASADSVERFTRAMMPLITAGPPGTTGYAEGRPRVHPDFRFWPCLIERGRVKARVELLPDPPTIVAPATVDRVVRATGQPTDLVGPPHPSIPPDEGTGGQPRPSVTAERPRSPRLLAEIALARSGDKGRQANIGLIARRAEDYARLVSEATPARVAAWLSIEPSERVQRFEIPNLAALNFVVADILDSPLRLDAQGKALGQQLLQMPLTQSPDSTT